MVDPSLVVGFAKSPNTMSDKRMSQALLKRLGIEGPFKFRSLEVADAKTLATLLTKEHPQTIAITIAHADTAKGAAILKHLAPDFRQEVVWRIAKIEVVDSEHLAEIDAALMEALRRMPPPGAKKFGGPEAVAKLLASMEPDLQKDLLTRLQERDQALAAEIENRLVSFDDILKLSTREIQSLTIKFSPREWAVALKNAGEEVQTYIFANMSERVAETLRDEIANLPPTRLSDVATTQKKIIEEFKSLLSSEA